MSIFEQPSTHEEALLALKSAYEGVSRLARMSLFCRLMGLTRPKNVITPEVQTKIDWTMQATRKGFQITSETTDQPERQLRELSRYPLDDDDDVITRMKSVLRLNQDFADFIPEASVLAFHIFHLTLRMLNGRRVSYAGFESWEHTEDIGDYEFIESRWNRLTTPESIWGLIHTLNGTIRGICAGDEQEPDKVLEAGHFFESGSQQL